MREHSILLGRKTAKKSRLGLRMEKETPLLFGGEESVCLHARTRAGKGVGFVIPNCFHWRGSLVVLDIKGEIARATAGYRHHVLKQDVYILAPTARDGRSHRWNPFSAVDLTSIDRFDAIAQVGNQVFPDYDSPPTGNSNSSAFWEPAGRQALVAAATLLSEAMADERANAPLTMRTLLNLFTRADGAEWFASRILARRISGDPYSQDAVFGLSDFLNGPEQQTDGIRKTVSTRLSAWANPRIAAATSGADFYLRDLRRRPMTIYVVVPPSDIPRMRPLLRLFFTQLIEANTDVTPEEDHSIKHQVLLMMDEFIRLGHMPKFAESLQYIAGYGMRAAIVIQSKSQVESRYGKADALDMFNNFGAEIVFGINDMELIRELEERLGDNTEDVQTINQPRYMAAFNWSKQSVARHPHRRPLMLKQEIRDLPDHLQLVFQGGRKDLTERFCWHDDPEFKDLVRPMPPIPQLELEIAYDDGTTRVLRKKAKEPQPNEA